LSKPRLVQPIGHRRALVSLLAMAALLTGAQALVSPSALALNDQNDECAHVWDEWERNQCEQDKGGTGTGGGSWSWEDSPSGSDASTADADSQPSSGNLNEGNGYDTGEGNVVQPAPTYTETHIFDHVFEEDGMKALRRTLRTCDGIWRHARRATRRNPRSVRGRASNDPNDASVQDELSRRWREAECNQVWDLLAHP
jgi:hypothetical protein